MAKFTEAQIESNIDNKVFMQAIDFMKDYIETRFNYNMKMIQENFFLLKSAIEGEDRAISHLGQPHEPGDTAPTNPNQYDWYFNTKDKRFWMYVSGVWKEIASLGGVVDLSDYYTIEEANEWFLAGTKATLTEVHNVEVGIPVEDQDAKYLNIVGLADILNDQHRVDELFLGKFSDELTYKNKDTIEYKDTILDEVTLEANVVTNGSSVTYSTLIKPFKRIEQEQASFEGKFATNMSVEYQFISKGRALKFSGSRNQTYKWEHVEKYDGDATREYIRFTGTGTMEVADAFVPGIPSTFRPLPMPAEIKLSELMDTTSGQAIVQFNFDLLPINGSKIMSIDYQTSTQFIVERYRNFLSDIYERVSKLETLRNIYSFPIEVGGFNNVTLRYQPTDRPGTMAVGDEFLIDIEPKSYATLTFNDTMTVMLLNEANVGGNPAANFAAVEPFVFDIHKTQTDKDNFANARHWDYFKNMVDKYYIVAKKARDVDGKIVWVTNGWIAKPQEPGDMKLVSRVVPAAQVWAEFQSSKALEKLIYINAHNTHDIESNSSAFWKDSNLRFDQDGRAVANVSNGHERQWKLTNTGIQIWEQGVLQRTKSYIEWDKFEIFELEGKAFVGYEAHQRDADLTKWANVGTGHEDEYISFNSAGDMKLVKGINAEDIEKKFETKMYDLTGQGISFTMTEIVDAGIRKLKIPGPNGYFIALKEIVESDIAYGSRVKVILEFPASLTPPQSGDLLYYNEKKLINVANGTQLTFNDIRNYYEDNALVFEKALVGTEEVWKWVGNSRYTYSGGAEGLFEPRQYDYSNTILTTTLNTTGGKRYIIITQPADALNTPIGATNKILFKVPRFVTHDLDQVTYGTDLIWIVKKNGDIMNWGEIKDHVADKERMIIKHLSNGNWELQGWEADTVSPKIQSDIDRRLTLNLDNVDTNDKKTAFINGLKAIGIDVSLFGEFKGVLPSAPSTAVDKDWYISTTDYISHVYHNSAWHQMSVAGGAMTRAQILTALGLTEADLTAVNDLATTFATKQDTLNTAAVLTLIGLTQAQVDSVKTLTADLNGKQDNLTISALLGILGINQAQLDAVKTLTADLAAKQDTLTTTMTLTFDDGSTQDVKVG